MVDISKYVAFRYRRHSRLDVIKPWRKVKDKRFRQHVEQKTRRDGFYIKDSALVCNYRRFPK